MKTKLRNFLKRIYLFGFARHCPVCGQHARAFRPFGLVRRSDSRCPWCQSLERVRLLLPFLRDKTDLFDGRPKKMLHFAPERGIAPILREALGDGYLTADLMSQHVMVKMDVTNIPRDDNSFDVICCNHVLEHVPEDRKAMREIFRTLKPGGWAVLNVPIYEEPTFEDPSITDPQERERLFGQHDHVRRYGPDYIDRLREAGFQVTRYEPQDIVDPSRLKRFGLTNGAAGDVYYCTKPSA